MNRQLLITKDGSVTIEIPEQQVTYHSRHGAIQESIHVFVEAGLHYFKDQSSITVFEMGFGTGLNALLALQYSIKSGIRINYEGFEKHPIDAALYTSLDYSSKIQADSLQNSFIQMHECEWNKTVQLADSFVFTKKQSDLLIEQPGLKADCVFYDAFAPSAQPELWTEEVFSKLYRSMNSKGILVTYCSKSIVQKAMKAAGFLVEKLPGPRGKREMLRAIKL